MVSASTRRVAAVGGLVLVLALAVVETAAADRFTAWSGRTGPFAWEAKRLSCGVVGERASRVRAHTLWVGSPVNGYVRSTFERQLRDEDSGTWKTVQRQRRSTRNTLLEGARVVLHWRQFFMPFRRDAGKTSRHRVRFEWLRDHRGKPDALLLRRSFTSKPCVVGG